MKKTACLIFACVLLFQVLSPVAYAAPATNSQISSYGAYVSNPSGSQVRIDFLVYGTGRMSSIGASTIDLYEDGTLVKTFSNTDPTYYSSMVNTNAYSKLSYVTYSGKAGSTYFAAVYVFATDSNGTGTAGCTTGTVTLPST